MEPSTAFEAVTPKHQSVIITQTVVQYLSHCDSVTQPFFALQNIHKHITHNSLPGLCTNKTIDTRLDLHHIKRLQELQNVLK